MFSFVPVFPGSISGTCSTVLFQPLDLVKTRLQQVASGGGAAAPKLVTPVGVAVAVPSPRPSMVSIVRGVLQNDSVIGLWKGITPSVTRTVPGKK